ncbi:acyl-CoA dehydrogenase family protein [Alloalcanivorax xenomutans]|jgi:acyl-CoA dehydrogenase|uniref:acyl-CoA dehydrogenase family protein n=1 Tax=Alloalcanivorax xenomutans TaxID=1094342 RepID=UPI0006D5BF58|nr:acyl-CoA dehydrogenase family protein [Alloalcanivorax xenomutans]KYZ85542.1 acyl-CoA dehydrogenase [Alcanivorax sp. KX64203]MBA4721854.1 acyl-CoA dehydrogenase family protein [Alcanivorax sp.]PHS60451.1 MAG: acyl-CoA dehydrogenase [Alcanivorax sp.]WOD28226.1 acyl-CoA dehydrogenase family protein [Alloalcanivorax xenomutans]CUR47954.1 Acyl-CoA dehydrogenase, short-chain specific [Alloalcanivorax xenomutans]
MDFNLPAELTAYLEQLDAFIEAEIKPLENQDDNIRFFDHRREWARTDFDNGGLPREEWEALLMEARRRADKAGHWRFPLPKQYGGQDGSHLAMTVIREHLAAKGLGLHNDLQNEHSIVANNPFVLMFRDFGTAEQSDTFIHGMLNGELKLSFGLTEPNHGSDATHMETRAVKQQRDGVDGWLINGEKMWITGMHTSTHCLTFARTSGKDGDAKGITALLVPSDTPGLKVEEYLWTFNMPTDHPRISFTDVWVPADTLFGEEGNGLALAQHFVHENRIRQAASSLGAAVFCIQESVRYARDRKPFGEALAKNQGIQFPMVELHTQAEMLRLLIRHTAWRMDQLPKVEVEKQLSDKVSMCNFWANRLCCEAADRAMQIHGGMGYSRHKPFEHIYRHHRRYRITEGAEEIQMRKVAAYLFGYLGPNRWRDEQG